MILNEHPASYRDEMHEQIVTLLDDGPWHGWKDRPGGVYLLRGDFMPDAERTLLTSVARAVLHGNRGTLSNQLDRPRTGREPSRALTGGIRIPRRPRRRPSTRPRRSRRLLSR